MGNQSEMNGEPTSSAAEVPGAFRDLFESALLAYFCNQPDVNREILSRASQKALVEGKLDYHAFFQGELAFAENNLPD